jgi:hypothetical protein
MKKLSILLLSMFAMQISFAQSEKYTKAMQTNVSAIDTIMSRDGWANLANTFQRIGEAEKTQWLPYYYASFSTVMQAFMSTPPGSTPDASVTDPLADKAEQLLNKAEELSKDNSEIYIVRKMISTVRMTADPMNRFQQYGPLGAEALAKAKQLNPENPRAFLLEGQDKFFTPEQFGGSKTEALKLFEEAKRKYNSFKPETDLHPRWGLNQVNYFIGLATQSK